MIDPIIYQPPRRVFSTDEKPRKTRWPWRGGRWTRPQLFDLR